MKYSSWLIQMVLVGLSAGACRAKSHSPFEETTKPATAASASSSVKLTYEVPQIKPEVFSVAVGPQLGVLPGRGLGPIRFGATFETIERLMQAKCTTRTETVCRFAPHAVEFLLEAGALVEIRVHGDERPFPGGGGTPDNTYGVFNGVLPGGAMLGMYEEYVVKVLGQPLSSEKLEPPQGATVLRHTYPNNMVLEYDKIANGNTVLAGIRLLPDAEVMAAAKAAAEEAQKSAAAAAKHGKPPAPPKKDGKLHAPGKPQKPIPLH